MRPLWLVAAIACGVFVLAGAASASVREEALSLASTLAAVTAAPGDGSPSPQATPDAEASPLDETLPMPSETTDPPRNHGEAVSAVARDKEAEPSEPKVLPNGKTISNHGMAVSEVARKMDGASIEPEATGGSNGKGHGNGK